MQTRSKTRARAAAAKAARNKNQAESAMRVWQQWRGLQSKQRNKDRNKAARAIQKHWRQALVSVPGAGKVRKVHRSRVVYHDGKAHNARVLNNIIQPPNAPYQNNYWPGTANLMNENNKARVWGRATKAVNRNLHGTGPAAQRRTEYLFRKLLAAEKAVQQEQFAPFRRAGWRYELFAVSAWNNWWNQSKDKLVYIPVQTRWSDRSLKAVLSRYFKRRVFSIEYDPSRGLDRIELSD